MILKNGVENKAMRFNEAKYEEWAEASQIPTDVMIIVQAVCREIGLGELEEEVIVMRNRGGYVYGYGKGFAITHCTSSYADGPSIDHTPTFIKFLGGLGFRVENSYGDNGMDSATNWHDTFWTKEVIYEPSIKYIEEFEEYEYED